MHNELEKIITDHTPTGEHHVQSVRERLFGPGGPDPSRGLRLGSIGRVRERLFGVPRRLLPAPYEPRGIIGEGAFGRVHRALDTKHDRYVALKIIGYANAEQEARIKREAQALAAIGHPNVVGIYDHGRVDDDRYFIALEYVPGARLDTWLQERERSLPEILHVFLQIAQGLRAVHEGKIVHRDFKPTNVIVGDDRRVRVLDFGLAKRLGRISEEDLEVAAVSDATITAADSGLMTRSTDRCDGEDARAAHSSRRSCPAVRQPAEPIRGRGHGQRCGEQYLDITLSRDGRFAGSVVYASPEQLTGQTVDIRSDIFSYCVALFEAAYGFRPFPGNSRIELATRIAVGEIAVDEPARPIPRWLQRLLMRGLSPLPHMRPRSLDEVIEAIEAKLRPRGRTVATVIGTAVLTAATVALAAAWWPKPPPLPMLSTEWTSSSEQRAGLDARYGAGLERALDDYEQQWTTLAGTVTAADGPPELVDCLRTEQARFSSFVDELHGDRIATTGRTAHTSMLRPRLWLTDLLAPDVCLSHPSQVLESDMAEAIDRLLQSQALQLAGHFGLALDRADAARDLLVTSQLTPLSGAVDFQRAYLLLQQTDPAARDAIESAKLARGGDEEFLIDALTLQVMIETHLVDPDERALNLPSSILELLEGLPGRRPEAWAWYHLSVGDRLLKTDRALAERHLRLASESFAALTPDQDRSVWVAHADLKRAYAVAETTGREIDGARLALDALNRLIGQLGEDHPMLPRWTVDVVQVVGRAGILEPRYAELVRPLLEGVPNDTSAPPSLDNLRATAELLLLDAWAAAVASPPSSPAVLESLYQRSSTLEEQLRQHSNSGRDYDRSRLAEAIATARYVADSTGTRPQTHEAALHWLRTENDPDSFDYALSLLQTLERKSTAK